MVQGKRLEPKRDCAVKKTVKRAAFFGSAARGDMTDGSDIDMLVEFLPNTRGIIFFSLQADLEEVFNKSVDLITFDALQHEAKDQFKKMFCKM